MLWPGRHVQAPRATTGRAHHVDQVPKPLHTCTRRVKGRSGRSSCRGTCGRGTPARPRPSARRRRQKVTMRCAHSASTIIMLPSRCCADSGRWAMPSANCSHSSTSSAMSLVLLVLRMRTPKSRRCSSSVSQMQAQHAEGAAGDHRQQLLGARRDEGLVDRSAASACRPKWPKNRNRMPTWNRLLPQRSRCRSSCDESLFQVYWSRSKRSRLPMQEDGQADVGVDAEDQRVEPCFHARTPSKRGLADHVRRLQFTGARLALRNSRRRRRARPSCRRSARRRDRDRHRPSRRPARPARPGRWHRAALLRAR